VRLLALLIGGILVRGATPTALPEVLTQSASLEDSVGTCGSGPGASVAKPLASPSGTISGRVVDEHLKPVNGAKVSAQRVRSTGPDFQVLPPASGQRTNGAYSWGPCRRDEPRR
jgi:hypothetical protein